MKYIGMGLICMMLAQSAYAGPGHDHGESAFEESSGTAGVFSLPDSVVKDLGIKTALPEKRAVANAVDMPFVIIPEANKTIDVYPSFAFGQIREVFVKSGDKVRKDQPLAKAYALSGLSEAVITAPIAGTVKTVGIYNGQRVTNETFIATISNPKGVIAKGELPEGSPVGRIKIGDAVSMMPDCHPEEEIKGRVIRVDTAFHPESRVYGVYASMEDSDHEELLRHTGEMVVWADAKAEAMVVPSSAIFGEGHEKFVFIRHEDGDFERHPVIVGRKNTAFTEVIGLHEGEEVVIKGGYMLQYAKGKKKEEQHSHKEGETAHDHESESHDHASEGDSHEHDE